MTFALDMNDNIFVAELFRDGSIRILVRDVGSQVRLGIDMPNMLTVLREVGVKPAA